MRISDWSSDVCSSDLRVGGQEPATIQGKYWVHTGELLPPWHFSKGLVVATKGYVGPHAHTFLLAADVVIAAADTRFSWEESREIGRASGRERVWQYV